MVLRRTVRQSTHLAGLSAFSKEAEACDLVYTGLLKKWKNKQKQ
jgi:hypothetical protein